MFSGKSSKLRSDAHMYAISFERKCLFLNSLRDTRGYMTHSGAEYPQRCDGESVDDLSKVRDKGLQYDVILIDEAHFMSHLYETVRYWHEAGKTVVVAGLITRFDGEQIGDIPSLNHLAETYQQFKAKCVECKDHYPATSIPDAAFTKRVVSGKEEVLVGGAESYVAVCGHHFQLSQPPK